MKNLNNKQTSKKMKKVKENNAEIAQRMLITAVRVNVHKYCALNHKVNILLKSMPMPKKHPKKAKDCPICLLGKLFAKMHEKQAIVSEACKTMEGLFNRQIDVDKITQQIMAKKYNADINYTAEDRPDVEFTLDNVEDGEVIMPNNTPQEIKDIAEKLMKGLAKNGLGSAKVEIINTTDHNFGLKQEDFENFGEFAKALSKKRKEAKENPEATLNSVILQKAEEDAKSEAPADKKLN